MRWGTPRKRCTTSPGRTDRELHDDGSVNPVGNTVDLVTGTYTNEIGDAQLSTVWEDPDFNPGVRAFYYLRVLQIPTPRHTLYNAIALGMDPQPNRPPPHNPRARLLLPNLVHPLARKRGQSPFSKG